MSSNLTKYLELIKRDFTSELTVYDQSKLDDQNQGFEQLYGSSSSCSPK